jgi:hypothetical protein
MLDREKHISSDWTLAVGWTVSIRRSGQVVCERKPVEPLSQIAKESRLDTGA